MKIELTYKFSKLDNVHEFGIEFFEAESREIYIQWIYFHMGILLGNKYAKFAPYPFRLRNSKVVGKYKFANNAQLQAKYITNKIIKIVNNK